MQSRAIHQMPTNNVPIAIVSLVDRDRQPKWQPADLGDVDTAAIDAVLAAESPILSFD